MKVFEGLFLKFYFGGLCVSKNFLLWRANVTRAFFLETVCKKNLFKGFFTGERLNHDQVTVTWARKVFGWRRAVSLPRTVSLSSSDGGVSRRFEDNRKSFFQKCLTLRIKVIFYSKVGNSFNNYEKYNRSIVYLKTIKNVICQILSLPRVL